MNSKNIRLLVVAGIALILVFWGCGSYNGLVNTEIDLNKSWNNVESQYQRRLDLFDNLVRTVKGAAKYEQETLEKVIQARSAATQVKLTPELLNNPEAMAKFEQAQKELMTGFGKLIATVEQYPQLRAVEGFLKLQDEIAGTENRINQARTDYNAAVADYNKKVRRFPGNIMAGIFGFKTKEGFKAQAGAENAPKIDF